MRVMLIAFALALSGCTTTTDIVADIPKPTGEARILVIAPDVQLAMLTASGVAEPKAEWTASGAANLKASIETALQTRGHRVVNVAPDALTDGRVGQLVRLNEVVVQSIQMHGFNWSVMELPTKKIFDWTIGSGAAALGETYEADYALFTHARGTYSSGGRVAATVFAAAVGVSLASAGQQVQVSLVELKTGRVVWLNMAAAGPNDMRTTVGATALVDVVMKEAPL